jgi:hypothetical protein
MGFEGRRWSEPFVTKNQRLAPYTHTTLGANSTGIERRSALAEATVLIGTRAFHSPIPCRGTPKKKWRLQRGS